MVGAFEDFDTPLEIVRFSADFASKVRLAVVEPRLSDVTTGTLETFEALAPRYDGSVRPINSTILLPPGSRRGDRLPCVVMIYPGMDLLSNAREFAGGTANTVPNAIFTSRGYAVLMANVDIAPVGAAADPVKQMVDVLLPQVYRAAELGYIDLNRLVLSGHSYGGYGTLGVVAQTDLFRGAIPVNGLSDLSNAYIFGESALAWAETSQGRMGTHPWSDQKRYLDNSPFYQLDRIHTPLLILAGDQDGNLVDDKKMFHGLTRLDRPVELAIYENAGHIIEFWSKANAVDANRRVIRFIEERIGPGS
jgi:dipeptidyl aminopeptidase/acylaminoacyl peptidase